MAPQHTGRRGTWWGTLCVAPVAALALVLLSAVSAMPRNLVNQSMPPRLQSAMGVVAPQGWAFFTRDARSPNHSLYRVGTNERTLPGSRRLLGLDRATRVADSQLMDLAGAVEEDRWVTCPTLGPLGDCLAEASAVPATPVELRALLPETCGSVVVVREEPVPWSYRHLVDTGRREAAHVDVRCAEVAG